MDSELGGREGGRLGRDRGRRTGGREEEMDLVRKRR